jgi:hypothetical protein
MKVQVFDYTSGEEQKLPTRYLDEVIESYCVGAEHELDQLYREARGRLKTERRFWLNQYIMLMPAAERSSP